MVFRILVFTYEDTYSMYIEKMQWNVLDEACLTWSNLCQCTIEYISGAIFSGLSLARKRKHCSTIFELGIVEEHKTFKGFNDSRE